MKRVSRWPLWPCKESRRLDIRCRPQTSATRGVAKSPSRTRPSAPGRSTSSSRGASRGSAVRLGTAADDEVHRGPRVLRPRDDARQARDRSLGPRARRPDAGDEDGRPPRGHGRRRRRRAILTTAQEGARLAALFAATYPERTAGLVLIDPTAKGHRTDDYPGRRRRRSGGRRSPRSRRAGAGPSSSTCGSRTGRRRSRTTRSSGRGSTHTCAAGSVRARPWPSSG